VTINHRFEAPGCFGDFHRGVALAPEDIGPVQLDLLNQFVNGSGRDEFEDM
jgi:hypothetical protein